MLSQRRNVSLYTSMCDALNTTIRPHTGRNIKTIVLKQNVLYNMISFFFKLEPIQLLTNDFSNKHRDRMLFVHNNKKIFTKK